VADRTTTCDCLEGKLDPTKLDRTFLGTDERSAEVLVERCGRCGRNWLCYQLEDEHVPRSGRWYRGLIGPDIAFSHRNAASIFGQLRDYWAGGSHFDGNVHLRSGPLDVS
jgi:hypothetical protein